MHNSMCTDMDPAMDPDMETLILIGPCSDLCCSVCVNRWSSLSISFASLFVLFLAIIFCQWKSTCDQAMPKLSKVTKEETEQPTELVQENVALYDQSSDDSETILLLSNTHPTMVSNDPVFVMLFWS